MATIAALSSTDALYDDDQVPIFSPEQNDTRKASLTQIAAYLQVALEGQPDGTIYSLTMSGSGFTASALPPTSGAGVWVQISLSATAPTGVINLPAFEDRAPGQEVLVTSTQAVTALTVNGYDAAVLGAPTSLVANGFFKIRYDSISNKWIRVG